MGPDYTALAKAAGFTELPGRTLIAVTGPDRAAFLHSFTTSDIKRLTPGQGCEAFVTSTQGKTIGHGFIFCEPERLILDTSPGQAAALIAHFERYLITEEVTFTDLTAGRRIVVLAGPHAVQLIERIAGTTAPQALLDHAAGSIAGRAVTIRQTPYAGNHSFFLETAQEAKAAVQDALTAAGAVACDPAAVEALRIEAGFPLFGRDITDDNLPQEVARDKQAISFTKGCYLGQETVARIDALGHVNRLLRGVALESPSVPAAGTALLSAGQPAGKITSAVWSPRLQKPLALAYVRRQFAKAGTELSCDARPATVVELPLA